MVRPPAADQGTAHDANRLLVAAVLFFVALVAISQFISPVLLSALTTLALVAVSARDAFAARSSEVSVRDEGGAPR